MCLNPYLLQVNTYQYRKKDPEGYINYDESWRRYTTLDAFGEPRKGKVKAIVPLLSYLKSSKLELFGESQAFSVYRDKDVSSKVIGSYVDGKFLVPCNSCQKCLIKRSREIATLSYLEYMKHKDACFLTLTYDDEHLGDNDKFDYTHIQKFKKRLSIRAEREYGKKGLKYVVVGEWGDTRGRKHWHILVFGWSPTDKYLDHMRSRTSNKARYRSVLLDKLWKYGWLDVDEVNTKTIFYVARYVQKKFKVEHDNEKPKYEKKEKFVTSIGLGRDFLISKLKEILDGTYNSVYIPICDRAGKLKPYRQCLHKIPDRFINWLKSIIDPRRKQTKYVEKTLKMLDEVVGLQRLRESLYNKFINSLDSLKQFDYDHLVKSRVKWFSRPLCNKLVRSLDKEI